MPLHPPTFSQLIAELAAGRVPGRLFAEGRELSFAELAQGAIRLAEGLAPLAGRRLLLTAAPKITFVQGLLACWQAGVLPLVMDDWLGRDTAWIEGLGAAGQWQDEGIVALTAAGAEPAQAGAEQPGLVLFTSGSSGRPKGVLLHEDAILGQLEAVATAMDLAAPASVAVILPLHHSFALITQLLLTLRRGGDLHLLPSGWLPGQRLDYLQAHAIMRLAGVPTHFRVLLEGGVSLPALRHLTVAGAALDAELAARIRAACPQAAIWVGYGLTEAGPRVSALSDRDPAFAAGSAGLPIPGVELRLREGELQLRSPYAMRGYLDDPAATAAVWVEDEQDADRPWLRTGDAARLERGYVYISGRLDEILNIGGEKVAPGAIEQVLLACPGVAAAAVYGEPDELLGTRLAALIQGEVSLAALRRYVRAQLPPEKRPRSWYAVSSLPLTSNGKLKRKELPAWPKRTLTPES